MNKDLIFYLLVKSSIIKIDYIYLKNGKVGHFILGVFGNAQVTSKAFLVALSTDETLKIGVVSTIGQ
jgi:hypothetical protein